MSRAARRREQREKGSKQQRKATRPIMIMAGFGLAAVLTVGMIAQLSGNSGGPPTPRAEAADVTLVSPARYTGNDRIVQVYQWAAQVPHVLDGLYCHCDCSMHSGHRSLLECFASDHGAGCDVCMTEAAMAYQMTAEGESLDDIRSAIDQRFAT